MAKYSKSVSFVMLLLYYLMLKINGVTNNAHNKETQPNIIKIENKLNHTNIFNSNNFSSNHRSTIHYNSTTPDENELQLHSTVSNDLSIHKRIKIYQFRNETVLWKSLTR